MTYTKLVTEHYGRNVGRQRVRLVWDAVTRTPQASTREIGEQLGLQFGAAATALRILRQAGYVEFSPGSRRARTIVVPFVLIRKEPRCSTD